MGTKGRKNVKKPKQQKEKKDKKKQYENSIMGFPSNCDYLSNQ